MSSRAVTHSHVAHLCLPVVTLCLHVHVQFPVSKQGKSSSLKKSSWSPSWILCFCFCFAAQMESTVRAKLFVTRRGQIHAGLGVFSWWDEIDKSEQWQRAIYYTLCACYAFISLVALVRVLLSVQWKIMVSLLFFRMILGLTLGLRRSWYKFGVILRVASQSWGALTGAHVAIVTEPSCLLALEKLFMTLLFLLFSCEKCARKNWCHLFPSFWKFDAVASKSPNSY